MFQIIRLLSLLPQLYGLACRRSGTTASERAGLRMCSVGFPKVGRQTATGAQIYYSSSSSSSSRPQHQSSSSSSVGCSAIASRRLALLNCRPNGSPILLLLPSIDSVVVVVVVAQLADA